MNDLGHQLTEKELEKLERRIAKVYKEARDELDKTVKEYFMRLMERDVEQKKLLEAGKITEQQYIQWRLAQIGRGERFEALRDEMARRYTQANEVAVSYVNDTTPGIYTLNRNYAAYTIDTATGGGISFPEAGIDGAWTMFDEQTIKRLVVENPNLMPYYPAARAIKRGIDLSYGEKQITSAVTSAILQGKSIKGIADDLQARMETMNRASAIRTARTAVTGAQNGGRQATYESAIKMGIKMRKRWLATLDNRTRHSHAILDGEVIEVGGTYSNGCKYPGDPNGAPHEIYNCRCTETAVIDGVDTSDAKRRARDPETGESVLVSDMSYQEWVEWKKFVKEQQKTVDSYNENGIINLKKSIEDLDNSKAVSKVASDYFKNKPDCQIGYIDFDDVELQAAKDMVLKLDELDTRYRSSLTGVKATRLPSGIGGRSVPDMDGADKFIQTGDTKYIKTSIDLNSEFLKSKKAIKNDFANNNRTPYGNVAHGVWANEKYANIQTLVHEYGHTICPGKINEIAMKNGVVNPDFMPFKRLYNQYMRSLRDKQREITAVRDSFAGRPNGLAEGNQAAKSLQDEYDAMCISNYSKSSVGEFIAEAFADYELSDNPKPYSIKVHEVLEKIYRKGD